MDQSSGKLHTTADKLGLVFRTKTELFYFLATECNFLNSTLKIVYAEI